MHVIWLGDYKARTALQNLDVDENGRVEATRKQEKARKINHAMIEEGFWSGKSAGEIILPISLGDNE